MHVEIESNGVFVTIRLVGEVTVDELQKASA